MEGADELNLINEATVESCINHLCNAMKKQIEDIEYFILKVKSYCAQMKTGGQTEDNRKECENRMTTTERRICTQLMFISRVGIRLANTNLSAGSCMDNFLKMLTQYYICLANLTKHFINRQKITSASFKTTKFEQLVQNIGKKLPIKIYQIITYIEDDIFDKQNDENDDEEMVKQKKKAPGKNDKVKVVRETKHIPKLILRIESFNKFIICLSKKTEHDLSKCLHIGIMRDFRIKTPSLRAAIEKARECGGIDSDSEAENVETDEEDDDIDLQMNSIERTSSVESVAVHATISGDFSGNSSSSGSIITEVNHNTSLRTTVMKNMAAINKKASKRKKPETEATDVDEQQKRKKPANKATATATATATRRSNRIASTNDN